MPELSEAYLELGHAYVRLSQLNNAVTAFEKAADLSSKHAEGYYYASQVALMLQDVGYAKRVLSKLKKISPNYPGLLVTESRVYAYEGNVEKSIQALLDESKKNPNNANLKIQIAEIYIAQKKYQEAIGFLSESINRKGEEVRDVSQQGKEHSQSDMDKNSKLLSYLLLGRCYRLLNEYDSAETTIKLGLLLDSNNPELIKELGYLYYSMHRDSESAQLFNDYLNKNPNAFDKEYLQNIISQMKIDL